MEFGAWHSVQTVGLNQRLGTPLRIPIKRGTNAVLRFRNGEQPGARAIWLTYYPNVMVEWSRTCL